MVDEAVGRGASVLFASEPDPRGPGASWTTNRSGGRVGFVVRDPGELGVDEHPSAGRVPDALRAAGVQPLAVVGPDEVADPRRGAGVHGLRHAQSVTPDFDALTLEQLRRRKSIKWRTYEPDVLPAWVAELDVPLAEPVRDALRRAVADDDTGYAAPSGLGRAFAGFAARRWGWTVDPERCWPVADVMVGVGEALTALTQPGAGVVICPPVYHPFSTVLPERDRVAVPVPLVDGALDLPGIDLALAAGASAVLLCSPHNPTGRVWTGEELSALDAVVREHGAVVVSDEVHAPLALPGAPFTSYLAEGDRRAVAVVSASKAFNLAGLKAALLVAGDEQVQQRLAALPPEVAMRAGHLGVLAGTAAYEDGDVWLDALLGHLDRNRSRLADLLAEQLPALRWQPPQASYLAWLDCRAVSEQAAAVFLERGRVALVDGTEYDPHAGAGWARLNFGTPGPVLDEAVRRMAVAIAVAVD